MDKEKVIRELTAKWYEDCLKLDIPVSPSDIKDVVEDLVNTERC